VFTFGITKQGVLDATREAAGHTLTLRIRNLRLNRDGYAQGLAAMIVDTTPVHSDKLDVDSDRDRHDFTNRLYGTRQTPGKFGKAIMEAFPQEDFEQELMVWARTVWGAYIGSSAGSLVAGDEDPSSPPWAVPGLVMAGATNIWAGDAGAGKSTLLRLLAQSSMYDVSTVMPVKQAEMGIWVNAEEPEREHSRQLGNVNAALGLPRSMPMFTLHARGMRIDDLATRLEKAVREQQATHIYIDSLSRLAQGMSLNDNNTATMLVDSLSGFGCSVTWIGHTGWANRERLAGSRHFENAARVMVLVQSRQSQHGASPDLTRGVRARVTKANGAIAGDDLYWTLNYHRQFGLIGAEMATAQDWPMLNCEAVPGEGKVCGRSTWDGVQKDGSVRCARHRDDGNEA